MDQASWKTVCSPTGQAALQAAVSLQPREVDFLRHYHWTPSACLAARFRLFATYGGYTLNVGDPGETLYEGRYLLIESTSVYGLVGGLPKEPLL